MPVATPPAALGSKAPTFTLPDVVTGERVGSADVVTGPASLVVFFCNHCPYAKAVEDRVIALASEMKAKGLATTLIASNDWAEYPDDAPEHLKTRAQQKQYPFRYLFDEDQSVAKAFDAACTPDFFLYDAAGTLAYRGRLDDNWKRPEAVKKQELRDAIVAVLEGKKAHEPQHPSLGCSIKWRD